MPWHLVTSLSIRDGAVPQIIIAKSKGKNLHLSPTVCVSHHHRQYREHQFVESPKISCQRFQWSSSISAKSVHQFRNKLTRSSSPISLQHRGVTVTRCLSCMSVSLTSGGFQPRNSSYWEGSFNLNPEKENNVARKKVQNDAHHLWSLWRPEGIKSKRNPIKKNFANCYYHRGTLELEVVLRSRFASDNFCLARPITLASRLRLIDH